MTPSPQFRRRGFACTAAVLVVAGVVLGRPANDAASTARPVPPTSTAPSATTTAPPPRDVDALTPAPAAVIPTRPATQPVPGRPAGAATSAARPGSVPPAAAPRPAADQVPPVPFDETAAREALTPVNGIVGSPGGDVPAPPAPVPAPRTGPVTGTYMVLPDEHNLHADSPAEPHEVESGPAVVRTDDGLLAPAEADPTLSEGDRVRVDVDGTTTIVAAAADARALAELPTPTTAHPVRVVGLIPAGAATPSLPDLQTAGVDLVNGPVNEYWSSQTDHQISFRSVSNQGWLQARSSCSDITGLFNEGRAAVGGVVGRGEHLVIMLPRNSAEFGCSYGLGTIGSLDAGGTLYATAGDWTVIGHELGHNLGLNHSDGTVCDTSADAVTEVACSSRAYASDADIMGSSGPTKPISSLASPQLATLGIGASVLGVDRSTKLRLTPMADRVGQAFTNGYTAATVTERDGTRYFVEYRSAAGRDGAVGRRRDGVLVWRSSPVTPRGFAELRGTSWAMDLQPGQSFTSASGQTRVAVESLGAAALVAIAVDGVVPQDPTFAPMSLSVPTPTSTPGVYQLSGRAWALDGAVSWTVSEIGGQGRRLTGTADTQRDDQSAPWSSRVGFPPGAWQVQAYVANPGGSATTVSSQYLRVTLTVG